MKPRKSIKEEKIAKERIEILFRQAEKEYKKHPELSDRYVKIARDIGMKVNVPIPRNLKRRFCKRCHSFLVFGSNAKSRLDSKRHCVLITCLKCGCKMRFPYIKEIKMRRQKH